MAARAADVDREDVRIQTQAPAQEFRGAVRQQGIPFHLADSQTTIISTTLLNDVKDAE